MNIKKIFTYVKNGILVKKIKFYIREKRALAFKGNDEEYLINLGKVLVGYKMDLKNPKTFDEKLNWLKLHGKRSEYTKLVDKAEVKNFVKNQLDGKYIIPTYGIFDDVNQIDFDIFPNEFVAKTTHDSGGVIVCKNKGELDIKKTKKILKKFLERKFSNVYKEYPYENVKPRIIVEKYMTDSKDSDEFTDYKFFCFDGYVDSVMVCKDRNTGHTKFFFMDKDWKLLKYNKSSLLLPDDFTAEKPENLDEMFAIASKLSKGMPFVRIDLYSSNGQTYFGEYTFFPDAGFDPNLLPEAQEKLGNLIHLENIKD